MKIEECNKIIAEFMGWVKCPNNLNYTYNVDNKPEFIKYEPTDSLDSLIQPLKKLPFTLMICKTDNEWIAGEMMWRELTGRFEVRDESASKALAMSVVKAIQELNSH